MKPPLHIHLVMTSTVYLPQNAIRTTEQNFLKMWVGKIKISIFIYKINYLLIWKTINLENS
jgi:hypothetical protein